MQNITLDNCNMLMHDSNKYHRDLGLLYLRSFRAVSRSKVTSVKHEQGWDWKARGNYLCSTEHLALVKQNVCAPGMFVCGYGCGGLGGLCNLGP